MKYAIYTKWRWPNGVATPEQMQGWHRQLKAEGTNAEEIIWWKMDDDHHQSVIVYPSQEAAQADIKKRLENRDKSSDEEGIKLIEETMGPIHSQFTTV